MLLMGLWHGAAWTYILWGLYHGLMLVIWDILSGRRLFKRFGAAPVKTLRIVLYFQVTALSLLIFRSNSIHEVGTLLRTLIGGGSGAGHLNIGMLSLPTMLAIPLFLVFDFQAYWNSSDLFYRKWPDAARGGLVAAMLILLLMGWSNAPAEFIYFQF
jgi:alginate O-acetyltransferase complex protein AlgI